MISGLAEMATRDRAWHAIDGCDVEAGLATRPGGLSNAEVEERLARFGPNELGDDGSLGALAMLLDQVRSPLVVILVVAGVVTTILGEYADATVIAAVVVLNTLVGFVQERQAERSVRALLLLVSPRARVVRNHEDWEIESKELVPGDVVLLESGRGFPPISA